MGKFQPGKSANPAGRPRGIKDRRARLKEALEEAAPDLVADLIRRAKEQRNLKVSLWIMERVIPPARSAPITAKLKLAGSPAERADAVVDALSDGHLSLDEGRALLDAIGAAQAIRENSVIADRLAALERQLAELLGKAP